MNGAMQGLATTQASTPVKKLPLRPPRDASRSPVAPSRPPMLNTPDRLSPTANIRYTSRATNHGCCSWKPQPSAMPAERRPSTSAPMAAKALSTPSVYQLAWLRALARLAPLCASPTTFSERIGRTQGIRLRISPPSRPRASALSRPPRGSGGAVLRAALSAEASAAGRVAGAGSSTGFAEAGSPAASAGVPVPASAADVSSATAGAVSGSAATGSALPAGSATCTLRVIGG